MMNYEHIDRATARKLYNSGKWVYFLPSKMNPSNPWMSPKGFRKEDAELDFDDLVECVKSNPYVCCKELGRYVKFYVSGE